MDQTGVTTRQKAKIHGEIQAKIQDNLLNFDKPPLADLIGMEKEPNVAMSAIDELLSEDRSHLVVDPTPSIVFIPVLGTQGIPLQPRAIIADPVDAEGKELDPDKHPSQQTPQEAWRQEEERRVQVEKRK